MRTIFISSSRRLAWRFDRTSVQHVCSPFIHQLFAPAPVCGSVLLASQRPNAQGSHLSNSSPGVLASRHLNCGRRSKCNAPTYHWGSDLLNRPQAYAHRAGRSPPLTADDSALRPSKRSELPLMTYRRAPWTDSRRHPTVASAQSAGLLLTVGVNVKV